VRTDDPPCSLSGNDYFHLFFNPLFKWNVSYLAQSACCGAWFTLPFEKDRAYEKDPDSVIFSSGDFVPQSSSFTHNPQCPHCRRTISGEFRYCPYCGKPL
jgi:hypothetical protein